MDQQSHLLVDHSELVYDYLGSRNQGIQRADFILDNYGPELVHDLGLADYLIKSKMARHIRMHAKPCPHYVSDAMIKDIHATIDYLEKSDHRPVQGLARRIKEYIELGNLELTEDYFWTSPLYFWEMPTRIYRELDASDLVISKGDANYRRLAGDLEWLPTTPFADVVRYMPSPLLALRVHKAELALGLRSEQVRDLDAQDSDWKVNGNWAVIQFYHP